MSDPTPPFLGLAEVGAQNHLHWTDAVTRRDSSVRCLSMQCFAEGLTRYQRAAVGSYQQAIHLTSPPLKPNLTSWPPCTIFGSPINSYCFPSPSNMPAPMSRAPKFFAGQSITAACTAPETKIIASNAAFIWKPPRRTGLRYLSRNRGFPRPHFCPRDDFPLPNGIWDARAPLVHDPYIQPGVEHAFKCQT
jgi:hypothetical protein